MRTSNLGLPEPVIGVFFTTVVEDARVDDTEVEETVVEDATVDVVVDDSAETWSVVVEPGATVVVVVTAP